MHDATAQTITPHRVASILQAAGLPLLPNATPTRDGGRSGYVVSARGDDSVRVEYELGCAATLRDPATHRAQLAAALSVAAGALLAHAIPTRCVATEAGCLLTTDAGEEGSGWGCW